MVKKLLAFLLNPKLHYRVNKNPLLDHILSSFYLTGLESSKARFCINPELGTVRLTMTRINSTYAFHEIVFFGRVKAVRQGLSCMLRGVECDVDSAKAAVLAGPGKFSRPTLCSQQ